VRPLGTGDTGGVLYVRLPGDGWELGAGFAVARQKVSIAGPLGFINGADDQDKRNVKLWIVAVIVLGASIFGILFSFLEHSMPMGEMRRQADKLKKGDLDVLQLPRFRAGFRQIATDINQGIQRVVEKGGGTARKPADLESILGPVPAAAEHERVLVPDERSVGASADGAEHGRRVQPARSGGEPERSEPLPRPAPAARSFTAGRPSARGLASRYTGARRSDGRSGGIGPSERARVPRKRAGQRANDGDGRRSPTAHRSRRVQSGSPAPMGAPGQGSHSATVASPGAQKMGMQATVPAPFPPPAPGTPKLQKGDEDEQTMVAQPSADLIAATGGHNAAVDPAAEWHQVYEEFLRTKRECNEPTDGLTFEKFQQTLKKNRDALMQRHGCKRVKFSVYVKEGRASLKATPVRD